MLSGLRLSKAIRIKGFGVDRAYKDKGLGFGAEDVRIKPGVSFVAVSLF